MKRDIIEINKELIPYEFDISLANETFRIGIDYNETAAFFTLSLSKRNEDTGAYDEICAGEPIVYGVPLWNDVYKSGKFPAPVIIPYDESGESDAVTFDNLNRTVFLTIDNLSEEEN